MSIKEYYVNPTMQQIKEYIFSESFANYISIIKSSLSIEDKETILCLIENGEVGFSFSTVATIGSIEDFCETNKIYVNPRKIAENITSTFETFVNDEGIFSKIVKIYVRLAVVHELIHVQQIKRGLLNEEIVKVESDKIYENRVFEQEALKNADCIVANSDKFSKIIIESMNQKCINGELKEIVINNQEAFR